MFLFLFIERSRNKPAEQGMGAVGAGFKLGMELASDKPRVVDKLDHFDNMLIGRSPRKHHAGPLELLAVVVVEFIAMTVALIDKLLAVYLICFE